MTIYLVLFKNAPTKHAFFKLKDATNWVESREPNIGRFMEAVRHSAGPLYSYHLDDYEVRGIFVKDTVICPQENQSEHQ